MMSLASGFSVIIKQCIATTGTYYHITFWNVINSDFIAIKIITKMVNRQVIIAE